MEDFNIQIGDDIPKNNFVSNSSHSQEVPITLPRVSLPPRPQPRTKITKICLSGPESALSSPPRTTGSTSMSGNPRSQRGL